MLIRRISVTNYSIFRNATFELATRTEQPLVLFMGSNGAGKTSLLEAFRLGLHGRRCFLEGISDVDYFAMVRDRFNEARFVDPMEIRVEFELIESGNRRLVDLRRVWTMKGERPLERLIATIDGKPISSDAADALVDSAVPPEVMRYFFFDGEKVKDLANWHRDDDARLFESVNELLGLEVIDQLDRDLCHIKISDVGSNKAELDQLSESLKANENALVEAKQTHRRAQSNARAAQRACAEVRDRFMSLGGMFAQERSKKEAELEALRAQIEALSNELVRESGAYLPLLVAPNATARILDQVALSAKLEEAEAISKAVQEADTPLRRSLQGVGIAEKLIPAVVSVVRAALVPKPIALTGSVLSLSLREASFIQSVLSNDLPRLAQRVTNVLREYSVTSAKAEEIRRELNDAPSADPKVLEALAELERRQRDLALSEEENARATHTFEDLCGLVADTRARVRQLRQNEFRNKRLGLRDHLLTALHNALPEYAGKLRKVKEDEFGRLIQFALSVLWHKRERVQKVSVSFDSRTIQLFGHRGEINKGTLSAGEQQLFATAFVYALAKLSGKHLPFAIDTPVGRLDRRHRANFIIDFLPSMSQQVILFSTDTEIVGSLYKKLKPLISHEFDLSEVGSFSTTPVQLEAAL